MNGPPVFDVRGLRFSYEGAARPALDEVDLQVGAGSLYAIIGPNGSGKSTLLKLLLGALQPQDGAVSYAGRHVADWTRRALAQQIGAVPQGEEMAFPITVREMVAMGRYPYLGVLGRPGPEDREAIDQAMERCDVIELAERPISRLSGGERQRALIARALAQRPATLVLDEPTVSLDIRHEMTIFELLAELTHRDGVTVVLVTHNLNLAARYADRLLLLDAGQPAAEGTPADVLSQEIIEKVYQWSVVVAPHPGPGRDAGAPQITPLTREN
ncbi:MAG: ATP-binding cassette domain-containing protein [Gemmatimonadetes bacterium]|nr:ATP-binding cassette domain-containing protein [Gemmatimonadota bacterium]NIO32807.1 ATP-binding cassette domain-containing protein [Gemmatimonadota bacterium]